MEQLPQRISMWDLKKAINEQQVKLLHTADLSDGNQAIWYTSMPGVRIKDMIEINENVYVFNLGSEALDWLQKLKGDPWRKEIKLDVDYDAINELEPLHYNLVGYDFFYTSRLKRNLKVVYENTLDDGRVSVLYGEFTDATNYGYRVKYHLAIGRLIFYMYSPENLLMLEAGINSGKLKKLRPELSGKMNYTPEYGVAFKKKCHDRYMHGLRIINSYVLPGNKLAEVYGQKDNPGKCKVLLDDLIYSFKTVADCEVIMQALINQQSVDEKPLNKDILKENFQLVEKRINRYVNSDLSNKKSDKLSLSALGSLQGLNAII